jgi:hypothetical protein
MSSHSSGHNIYGGTFYNVGGDVTINTHHLNIQSHEFHAAKPLSGLTLGFQDDRAAESHQHPSIPDFDSETYDAAFQPSPGPTLGLGQAEGSKPEFAGVSRNRRHGMAARPAPYGAPKILLDNIFDSHTF